MKLCERRLANNDFYFDEIRDLDTNNLRQILNEVKDDACIVARNMELTGFGKLLVEIEEDSNGMPQANIYKDNRIITQIYVEV